MNLLAILGLSVSSNLDTLGVGLAYGTRKFRLPFLSNLICAVIPCAGTYITMVIGSAVRSVISEQLANILGASVIIAAGGVLILPYFRKPKSDCGSSHGAQHQRTSRPPTGLAFLRELGKILEDPFRVDYDYSGSIEVKEAVVLALALTLNNLSCGFAAGLMGLNIFAMIVASFVISLVFFYIGIRLGFLYIARWFGEKGDIVAAIILILVGIYELFF